jgi:hypothetical protein
MLLLYTTGLYCVVGAQGPDQPDRRLVTMGTHIPERLYALPSGLFRENKLVLQASRGGSKSHSDKHQKVVKKPRSNSRSAQHIALNSTPFLTPWLAELQR